MKQEIVRDRFDNNEFALDFNDIVIFYDKITTSRCNYKCYLDGNLIAIISTFKYTIIEGDDFRSNKHQSDFWNPPGDYKIHICPFCKEPNERDEPGNCEMCSFCGPGGM